MHGASLHGLQWTALSTANTSARSGRSLLEGSGRSVHTNPDGGLLQTNNTLWEGSLNILGTLPILHVIFTILHYINNYVIYVSIYIYIYF